MNEIVLIINILLVLLQEYGKPAQTFNSVAPDSSSYEFTTSNIMLFETFKGVETEVQFPIHTLTSNNST